MEWELARAGSEDWLRARVPGTVADVVGDGDHDEHDWVFRARFAADAGPARLALDGVATYGDVALNGEPVLSTESMFLAYTADVALRAENELTITCRALAPMVAAPRKPRARWRTRLVDNGLRWHRTQLLGRAPGIAPGPPVVGPYRPVRIERDPGPPRLPVRTRIDGDDGVVLVSGEEVARIGGVERWWPHTHGEPRLYDVEVEGRSYRVGFRDLALRDDGFGLVVNGVDVFARGAVWSPGAGEPRAALERARDAGMNIVRVVGTARYEDDAFWDACDELGLLVWQDFMFANLDYPVADEHFRSLVEMEAWQAVDACAGRPSLAVLCGNSEVSQQVAMLGLDPDLARGPLFDELLPQVARQAGAEVPYVPSAPSGGALPFRPNGGVAHYFGVGGYRRPLADARRADVRFAAECLAFANWGDGAAGFVPADNGADWTFADVTDHYVRELYGAEPRDELRRQVTGEVMAEVLGEWRRAGSPCAGAIVLWLRDLLPGAGWGVLDASGAPKLAWHALRRALAPVAVWTTDEGQNGIWAHTANDGPAALRARLRVALYADGETCVGEGGEELALGPHETVSRDVEGILGRFADVSWAYRFGPPAQDVVVVSLEDPEGALLSQAFRFPVGPPLERRDLGLEARAVAGGVELVSRRCAWGVRVQAGEAEPADDGFCLEPGRPRFVAVGAPTGSVTALNLEGAVSW